MNGTRARVPAGIPTGGRFATSERPEASVSLGSPRSSVAPSLDVVDSHLAASGFTAGDPLGGFSRDEVRNAYRLGHEAAIAAASKSPTTQAEAFAAARHQHGRDCTACHGADQSCIQIEEQFVPVARHMLEIARQVRLGQQR